MRLLVVLLSLATALQVAEKTNVKLDWDRYVDEDDAAGSFDTSAMGDASVRACDPLFARGAGPRPPLAQLCPCPPPLPRLLIAWDRPRT